jgi:hypothetical protein
MIANTMTQFHHFVAANLTGSHFEEVLIHLEHQLLAELPRRAQVQVTEATKGQRSRLRCGKVYDAFGGESGQTDPTIANQDQPFTYPKQVPGEYLIGGLSAVGEIITSTAPVAKRTLLDLEQGR